MPITCLPRRRLHDAGFSLVEVLVSIVVLCIGLLGMVALQANSLQANRESRLQSSAVALARELAEMVRGNRGAAGLAAGNTPANPYLVDVAYPNLTLAVSGYCLSVGSNCAAADEPATATAIATAQMTEWLARVDSAFPGARVVVCFDSSPYDAAGLPEWQCTNAGTMLVVKIGWTRASLNRTGLSGPDLVTGTNAKPPGVVLSLTAGQGVNAGDGP